MSVFNSDRDWLRNAPQWIAAILAVGAAAYICAVQHYRVTAAWDVIHDHEARLRAVERSIAELECGE